MRITSWNFLHGQPLLPGNTADSAPLNAAQIVAAKVVAELKSDVVALQEVDYRLARSMDSRQIADVAQAMGTQWWSFAPAIKGTPGEKWRALDAREQQVLTVADSDSDIEMYGDIGNGIENGYYGIGIASTIPVSHWQRLELGRAWIGMPLVVSNAEGKPRFLYLKDEPRVAMAAVLDNGWTVINTHLSFVPFENFTFEARVIFLVSWGNMIEIEASIRTQNHIDNITYCMIFFSKR
jgi:endonuclease/exonuclease/phosphatase family metal-dependent hydrolase